MARSCGGCYQPLTKNAEETKYKFANRHFCNDDCQSLFHEQFENVRAKRNRRREALESRRNDYRRKHVNPYCVRCGFDLTPLSTEVLEQFLERIACKDSDKRCPLRSSATTRKVQHNTEFLMEESGWIYYRQRKM